MFISYYHYLQHLTEYVLCACVNECLQPKAHLVGSCGSTGDLVLHLVGGGVIGPLATDFVRILEHL